MLRDVLTLHTVYTLYVAHDSRAKLYGSSDVDVRCIYGTHELSKAVARECVAHLLRLFRYVKRPTRHATPVAVPAPLVPAHAGNLKLRTVNVKSRVALVAALGRDRTHAAWDVKSAAETTILHIRITVRVPQPPPNPKSL